MSTSLMRTAEIIAIGSELLTPTKIDTNSLWFTEKLDEIGIGVMLKTIVGDDAVRLEAAIRDALTRSDIVITTGGLGPTEDDITRAVAAKAVSRELIYRDDIEQQLRERFKRWTSVMPEINKRQAYVIEGSDILPNPNGSAVGMLLELGTKMLVILPGPPRENQPMFVDHVYERLRSIAGETYVSRRLLRVSGMGESAVDEIAAPIYTAYDNVQTSILIGKSEIELRIAARESDPRSAQAAADEVAEKITAAIGIAVFSTNGDSMEQVIGKMLVDRGETLALAESCTGGLVSRRITEIAGSSRYFIEGAVTYSNEAKVRTLGVDPKIIEDHGAVSADCAEAMARGIRERSGAAHAISITGIAGPDGGTEVKPVGTVYIGYSGPAGTRSRKFVFPGDRYLIRRHSSQAALDYLRRQMLKL
ncbi:MAG: competence/damage-inducible protein A [Chloracidobacterium sp.]|nr:competence/damage-inducible protein A [Chloracidobacterium sp.]